RANGGCCGVPPGDSRPARLRECPHQPGPTAGRRRSARTGPRALANRARTGAQGYRRPAAKGGAAERPTLRLLARKKGPPRPDTRLAGRLGCRFRALLPGGIAIRPLEPKRPNRRLLPRLPLTARQLPAPILLRGLPHWR